MGKIDKTKSGRWEVKGDVKDPKSVWRGKGWQSQPPADEPNLAQIAKWIEDMGDWCEMMHDTVDELRERVSSIEGLRLSVEHLGEDVHQLDHVVKSLSLPPGTRPAPAKGPQTRGAK
jgi:hypothetical protein